MSAGTLYVVATPIGNLEDITLRAIRVLREVSLIAAEDTRHSRKLLDALKIRTPLLSYHDHVERERAPRLVERLRQGQDVALISDAGTPAIADPGYRLVRAALEAGVKVVPVPGPSVVVASLSVSGLPLDRFAFDGFVPARSSARRRFFARLAREERTVVCFEAGRRLLDSLADLREVLGERDVVVAREVTKLFEEFARGTVSEVRARLADRPVRGEVTLLVGAAAEPVAAEQPEEVEQAIGRLRAEGMSLKDIARRLAKEGRGARGDLYRIGLRLDAARHAGELPEVEAADGQGRPTADEE